MKNLFIVWLSLVLAFYSYAAPVESELTALKLLGKDSKAAVRAAGKDAAGFGEYQKPGIGFGNYQLPNTLKLPISQTAIAPANADAIKAAKQAQLEKQAIYNEFKKLDDRAKQLKENDAKYFAPWEPAAKRVDWQAKEAILAANKPLTVTEIAFKLNLPPKTVGDMIERDQANTRHVFCKFSEGKIWVSSSKLPY